MKQARFDQVATNGEKALLTELSASPKSGCDDAMPPARQRAELLTAKLWPKMSQAYGYKFASQFGDEPNDVWIGSLAGLSGEQLAEGLRRCAECYPQWPPGAIEFRALCLGNDPRNVDGKGNDAGWQQRVMAKRSAELDAELAERRLRLTDGKARARAKAARDSVIKAMRSGL